MPEHGRSHPGPMRVPTCLCGEAGVRDPKHDAYYCPVSNAWLEPKCGDVECVFCRDRYHSDRIPPKAKEPPACVMCGDATDGCGSCIRIRRIGAKMERQRIIAALRDDEIYQKLPGWVRGLKDTANYLGTLPE